MDKVIFNEEKHQYNLVKDNGEKIDLVSVTQLLKKHNLAPDYSVVSDDVLKAKAERGKVVHEELEKYIKYGEVGFTGELEAFIAECKIKKITPQNSEFMVWNDEIAGTVDVAGIIGENELPFIGDFKTTATLHKDAVAWQLSLYAYLTTDTIYERFICFHFPDAETCRVVEITPVPVAKIEKLLECERNCELYQEEKFELTIAEEEKILAVQTELKKLDDRKKELEKAESELRNYLIEKMEETGTKMIDNDMFRITYVAPVPKETIDTTRLKKEKPEIAAEYLKSSLTKASVRITLKG